MHNYAFLCSKFLIPWERTNSNCLLLCRNNGFHMHHVLLIITLGSFGIMRYFIREILIVCENAPQDAQYSSSQSNINNFVPEVITPYMHVHTASLCILIHDCTSSLGPCKLRSLILDQTTTCFYTKGQMHKETVLLRIELHPSAAERGTYWLKHMHPVTLHNNITGRTAF